MVLNMKCVYQGRRIDPANMGYINLVIPSVKVNCAEEGIRNPEYILLWFQRKHKSQIGIGSLYHMTYSGDGIYVPIEHGSNTIRSQKKYRKGKGYICRLCRKIMEAIPYGHRRNTKGVRGPYAGYAVRAWKQYRTVIEEILYKHKGSTVRAQRIYSTSIEDLVLVRYCVCAVLCL